MTQSVSAAAVRGIVRPVITEEQKSLLLENCDIDELLKLHHSVSGSLRMEDDDEDDEDDDEDDDNDDDDDDTDDGDDDDDDDDDDSDDEDDKAKGKKKAKVDPKDKRIQELSAESKRYRLKNRDHRNTIADLQREVAELKRAKGTKPADKDKSTGNEDPAPDREAQSKLDAAERRQEDLLIQLEFMADTTHQWVDPKAALRLLDLRDIEIDDGEVIGLDDAISELARKSPYLLKTEKKDSKDETRRRRQGATGQPTGGKRKGTPNRAKLEQKYPALRR
jgi:hypothetical protein